MLALKVNELVETVPSVKSLLTTLKTTVPVGAIGKTTVNVPVWFTPAASVVLWLIEETVTALSALELMVISKEHVSEFTSPAS